MLKRQAEQVGQRHQNATSRRVILALLSLGVFFATWEFAWWISGGVGFAHSWQVIAGVLTLLAKVSFWLDLVVTLGLTLLGLALGTFGALVVGAALSSSNLINRSSEGVVFFLRGVPAIVLIPLLMVSVGSRLALVLWLTGLVVGLKMMVFVIRGLSQIPTTLDEQAKIMGLSRLEALRFVRLPFALHQIVLGIRLSAARAYSAVLLGGLLAGTPGFGADIAIGRINGDTPLVLAYVVVSAAVGVLLYSFLGKISLVDEGRRQLT